MMKGDIIAIHYNNKQLKVYQIFYHNIYSISLVRNSNFQNLNHKNMILSNYIFYLVNILRSQ
jgi:hypothetical protein